MLVVSANGAQADVELQINEKHYRFEENPRLSNVLSFVANQDDWYWPNAGLFRLDSNEFLIFKQQLINNLNNEESSISEIARNLLLKQINSWNLADRVAIDIDFDLARYNPKHNPIIEDGKYVLNLSKRGGQLFVFGAIKQEANLSYEENSCLSDVIGHVDKFEFADNSYVYVISPTGVISRAPVAYWNQQCTLVLPGSQIYIPVQENQFFPSIRKINEAVAQLAVNRKLFP